MLKFFAVMSLVLFVVYGEPSFAQQQGAINVPLSLQDQAKLIPMLCDRAMFGYRAELQFPCDQIRAKLAAAIEAEGAKMEQPKAATEKTNPEPKDNGR